MPEGGKEGPGGGGEAFPLSQNEKNRIPCPFYSSLAFFIIFQTLLLALGPNHTTNSASATDLLR